MRADLHVHTSCSDGTLPPGAVAVAAGRAGLDVIAITDHDTVAGLAGAAAAVADHGPVVLAGIELSASWEGVDLHVLGYGFEAEHPAMRRWAERLAAQRRRRAAAIVERLNALGVPLELADVRTPEGNAMVGRPHIAAALVRRGFASTIQETFARWLADGAPAHVGSFGPDVSYAIETVHEAGGLAVWAHPAPEDARRVADLAALGLDGVEAYRPAVAGSDAARLRQAAEENGLFVSGGSDWHGGEPPLGSWSISGSAIAPLLERLGITVR